jgi:uncharacterized protein (DUF2336 family)
LAISARTNVEETVSDTLLSRGNLEVINRLAANSGARLSDTGLQRLVSIAEKDEGLAEKVGLRADIPAPMLQQLLTKTTEAVRRRLLTDASQTPSNALLTVASAVADEIARHADESNSMAASLLDVVAMQKKGELDEQAILQFAKGNQHNELVAALAIRCSASLRVIEPLVRHSRNDGVLIPCKAANFGWPTVAAILQNRFGKRSISDQQLAGAKIDYERLSQSVAQRLLRFWQIRKTVSGRDPLDNRKTPRRLALEIGTIEYANMDAAIDCAIVDIAAGGACLVVQDAGPVPETFSLTVNYSGAKHLCSKAWQSNNRIGVSIQGTTSAPQRANREAVPSQSLPAGQRHA